MLEETNEVRRRGTDDQPQKRKQTWPSRLLKGVFWFVFVVGKIFDLIKWASQFFGE